METKIINRTVNHPSLVIPSSKKCWYKNVKVTKNKYKRLIVRVSLSKELIELGVSNLSHSINTSELKKAYKAWGKCIKKIN